MNGHVARAQDDARARGRALGPMDRLPGELHTKVPSRADFMRRVLLWCSWPFIRTYPKPKKRSDAAGVALPGDLVAPQINVNVAVAAAIPVSAAVPMQGMMQAFTPMATAVPEPTSAESVKVVVDAHNLGACC